MLMVKSEIVYWITYGDNYTIDLLAKITFCIVQCMLYDHFKSDVQNDCNQHSDNIEATLFHWALIFFPCDWMSNFVILELLRGVIISHIK